MNSRLKITYKNDPLLFHQPLGRYLAASSSIKAPPLPLKTRGELEAKKNSDF